MWLPLFFFLYLLFLYPCPQFQHHSSSSCLQNTSYFYCSFRYPPNISKWLCECRAFHCVCRLTFIAVQHLFMHFISESRTLPLLHHNLLQRPEPTWVVLYSLLSHLLPLHSVMLIPTWLQLEVIRTMRSCSLSAILAVPLFIALRCRCHVMKPCHRRRQWAGADAPHMGGPLLRFLYVARGRVASLATTCFGSFSCLTQTYKYQRKDIHFFSCLLPLMPLLSVVWVN